MTVRTAVTGTTGLVCLLFVVVAWNRTGESRLSSCLWTFRDKSEMDASAVSHTDVTNLNCLLGYDYLTLF